MCSVCEVSVFCLIVAFVGLIFMYVSDLCYLVRNAYRLRLFRYSCISQIADIPTFVYFSDLYYLVSRWTLFLAWLGAECIQAESFQIFLYFCISQIAVLIIMYFSNVSWPDELSSWIGEECIHAETFQIFHLGQMPKAIKPIGGHLKCI